MSAVLKKKLPSEEIQKRQIPNVKRRFLGSANGGQNSPRNDSVDGNEPWTNSSQAFSTARLSLEI
jgi:hypothetical protein